MFRARQTEGVISVRPPMPFEMNDYVLGVVASSAVLGFISVLIRAGRQRSKTPVGGESHETAGESSETARALRESEERYREFVERSTEGIWRWELNRPWPKDKSVDEQLEHF